MVDSGDGSRVGSGVGPIDGISGSSGSSVDSSGDEMEGW